MAELFLGSLTPSVPLLASHMVDEVEMVPGPPLPVLCLQATPLPVLYSTKPCSWYLTSPRWHCSSVSTLLAKCVNSLSDS